jgi:hypothetical protein
MHDGKALHPCVTHSFSGEPMAPFRYILSRIANAYLSLPRALFLDWPLNCANMKREYFHNLGVSAIERVN